MRFSNAVVLGFAAAVSAQSTTSSASAAVASTEACLKACGPGQPECQSHCITVPSPNEQQANDTNKCVAACPKGDGSPDQTKQYSDCLQGCIEQHYYTPSEGTPSGNGGSGSSGSGSGSGSNASNASNGGSSASASPASSGASAASGASSTSGGFSTGTQTSTGAAATKTNAAPGVTFGSSGALVGAIAALLAL